MAEVAPAVATEVVKAYYPQAIEEADNARSRAQSAYTIAAAIAAAIVAAGVFGEISKEHDYVQWIGVSALVVWLTSALLYIWAVSGAVDLPGAQDATSPTAFVAVVLSRVQQEHKVIETRIRYALIATIVAVILTVAAIIPALTTSAPATATHGRFSLTKAGQQAVGQLCGGRPRTVTGTTDPSALNSAFVKVTLDKGCGGRERALTIRMPKSAIAAFATR